jgi:hypothetical protein
VRLALFAMVAMTSPAFAMTLAEEGAAIEAACNGMQLGLEQCACIAADAVDGLDAHMRGFVLMSLEDEVGFSIRARSGEFANEDIAALNQYQQYVQAKCAPGAAGGLN